MFKKTIISLMLLSVLLAFSACSRYEETEAPYEEAEGTEAVVEEAATEEQSEAAFVPEVLDYTTGLDDNGFYADVTAVDHVTMFDYKGMEIPEEVHLVTDEAVDMEVQGLLTNYTSSVEVTDRAIVNGDTVNIDYVGSVDGVEFEGGNTGGAGTDVTIGVTSYIDDFLEQLIGHTPGETVDVEVTFPEAYGVEELNGQDALFVVTINHISESVEPELNDAFVAENLSEMYQWSTVAEMEDGIRQGIHESAVRLYIQSDVLERAASAEVPESVVDYQKANMANYYRSNANNYGMSLEEFLSAAAGQESLEAVYEANSAQLEDMARFSLILQAIAEDADLEVTEEVLTDYFTEINGTGDYTQFEEIYGLSYLKYSILQEVVMDYLIDNAVLQ